MKDLVLFAVSVYLLRQDVIEGFAVQGRRHPTQAPQFGRIQVRREQLRAAGDARSSGGMDVSWKTRGGGSVLNSHGAR